VDVKVEVLNAIVNTPENSDDPVESSEILESFRSVQNVEVVVVILDEILDGVELDNELEGVLPINQQLHEVETVLNDHS